MLVMANIALELDWLSTMVAVQLNYGMAQAGDILDGTATTLGQVSGSVLFLGLAQDDELHATIGGFVVVVGSQFGPYRREARRGDHSSKRAVS